MKKKGLSPKNVLSAFACLSILFVSTSPSMADEGVYNPEGMYIGGNIGLAIANDADSTNLNPSASFEHDYGYAINAAIGYSFGNNMRVETEIGYQENDLDEVTRGGSTWSLSGESFSTSLMVNGYFDFTNGGPFVTFVTAGIGVSRVEVDGVNIPGLSEDGDDTVLAYQVGAGIGYMVTDKVTIDVKYRYFATEDPDFGLIETDYSSHNIYGGVRIGL